MSDHNQEAREAAEEIFGKDSPQAEAEMPKAQNLAVSNMKSLAGVGMSKVDPLDIRPPMILLVQKSSDKTEMVNADGAEAKIGQFYHTGKREVMSAFDCHILFAAKKTWINRRKPELGELPEYSALGVLKSDVLSEPPILFAINFRSSALFCLSGLFSAVQAQQKPMFSFNVTFETKQLEGKLGSWYVPVCRVHDVEKDEERFNWLYVTALQFDKRADMIGGEDE